MPNIIISEIKPEETWDIRHRVMWPHMPFDFVKLENDSDGKHFGLFIDDKLISIVSLFIENNEAQFRKFATETTEQGKGYGTKLLTFLMSEIETMNINKIWCNSRVDKTKFYESFELKKTRNTYNKGGIDFVILEKNLSTM